MARVYITGFETRHTTSEGGTTTVNNVTYDTSIFRTGSASLKVNATSGVQNYAAFYTTSTSTNLWTRFYLRVTARPSTTARVLWGSVAAGNANLRLNPDGTIAIYSSSTLIGTSTTALTDTSAWYMVEVRTGSSTTTAGPHDLVRINGVAAISGTNLASGTVHQLGPSETVADTFTAYYDDYVVDDAGWPGAGKVVLLTPTAQNSVTAATWQKPGGATTGMNTSVDNVPPVGVVDSTAVGDAEKQIRNAVSNATADVVFAMTTYAAAGITGFGGIDAQNPAAALSTSTGATITTWQAQSFLSSGATVSAIDIWPSLASSPDGSLIIELRNDSGSDTPGSVLATSTVAASSLTTGVMATFTLDSAVALTAGTRYWITARRTTPFGTIALYWSTFDYPSGSRKESTNSGGSWGTASTSDFYFRARGTPTGDTINNFLLFGMVATASQTSIPSVFLQIASNPVSGTLTTATLAVAGTFPTGWTRKEIAMLTGTDRPVAFGESPTVKIGKRTASTRILIVCSVGIYVDYTPAAAGPTVVQGSFTADAIIKATPSASFTANAVIRRTESATFTADAMIRQTVSGSFVADAIIRAEVAGSFTANAVIKQTLSASFTADAVVLKTMASSFTADSTIAAGSSTVSESFSADAIIRATATSSFVADAIIKNSASGSFVADAIIRQTFSGNFVADATILRTESTSFTADARLFAWGDWSETWQNVYDSTTTSFGSFSADAVILNAATDSFVADAVIKRAYNASFTADAIIRAESVGSFVADAVISNIATGSFTANAVILAAVGGSFSADAFIRRTETGSFVADSIIRRTEVGTFTANAVILNSAASSFTADAMILRAFVGSFTADANIRSTLTGSFLADAIIRRSESGSFTADSIIRVAVVSSFTADALILATTSGSFTANARLLSWSDWSPVWTNLYAVMGTGSGSFTADAIIKASVSSSFTADAVIKGTLAGAFTANAIIRATASGSFTSDAIIRQTVSQSFVANAVIRNTFSGAFNADAMIRTTPSGSFTASAVIKNAVSASFTADAMITSITGGSFTADAMIAANVTTVTGSFTANAIIRTTRLGALTADAIIKKTQSGAFTADAYIQTANVQSFTMDAIVRATTIGAFTANAVILNRGAGSFTADANIVAIVTSLGSFTADAMIGPYNPGHTGEEVHEDRNDNSLHDRDRGEAARVNRANNRFRVSGSGERIEVK